MIFVKNFDSPQLVPSTLCYSGHVFAPPNAYYSHASSTSSLSLSCINVSVMDVRLALAQLADSVAGPDGIPATFYKKLAHYLAEPLACVYQQSLHQAPRHVCLMNGNRPKSLQSTKAKGIGMMHPLIVLSALL